LTTACREEASVVALDAPGASAPTTWRPPAARRYGCLALVAAAVVLAIVVVVTGPPRSVAFDIRLPLVVVALGTLWNAALWRRRVTVTPDQMIVRGLLRTRRIPLSGDGPPANPGQARRSVPVATPWLILTSTAGVAALTIKWLTARPELAGAVLAVGMGVCCLSLGACVLRERGDVRSAVVAEDGLGESARVVLEQAPAGAAQAKH
jgi:hypothetical protein